MPLPLISFFVSLLGIVLMLGNKITKLRNGKHSGDGHLHEHLRNFAIGLHKIRQTAKVYARSFGYVAFFVTFRFIIKSVSFAKIKSRALLKRITSGLKRQSFLAENLPKKREVSKYLKIISEYREKIRRMKHRIKEEEGIE